MGEVLKTSKGKQEMWRGLRGTVSRERATEQGVALSREYIQG